MRQPLTMLTYPCVDGDWGQLPIILALSDPAVSRFLSAIMSIPMGLSRRLEYLTQIYNTYIPV